MEIPCNIWDTRPTSCILCEGEGNSPSSLFGDKNTEIHEVMHISKSRESFLLQVMAQHCIP